MIYNEIKFNVELLKDKKVAINCKTEDEAMQFIKFLDRLKGSKSPMNQWRTHEEFTCYALDKNNNWSCCDIAFYTRRGFKILSFDEVLIREINGENETK